MTTVNAPAPQAIDGLLQALAVQINVAHDELPPDTGHVGPALERLVRARECSDA